MDTFATVSTYQAKAGEEDAIIALYEDWQRSHDLKEGLSLELLRKIASPREFMVITYFASEDLARAAESDFRRNGRYDRLLSLIENRPVQSDYRREWV